MQAHLPAYGLTSMLPKSIYQQATPSMGHQNPFINKLPLQWAAKIHVSTSYPFNGLPTLQKAEACLPQAGPRTCKPLSQHQTRWAATLCKAFNQHVLQGRPGIGRIPLLPCVLFGGHDTCSARDKRAPSHLPLQVQGYMRASNVGALQRVASPECICARLWEKEHGTLCNLSCVAHAMDGA